MESNEPACTVHPDLANQITPKALGLKINMEEKLSTAFALDFVQIYFISYCTKEYLHFKNDTAWIQQSVKRGILVNRVCC